MPVFWFGLMLQLLFAVRLGWLPSAGMYSPGGGGLLDLLRHLVLPAFTIAIGSHRRLEPLRALLDPRAIVARTTSAPPAPKG